MTNRWTRRPGVKPNTFQAPWRLSLVAATTFPDAWSEIVGTPITLGMNDLHGDCVTVAAYNAVAVTNARKGIMKPFKDHEPFDLYAELGGMPLDEGLDPSVLFHYWADNPIGGYWLSSVQALGLNDHAGIKQAIVDTGFVYFTATLTQAQLTQKDWTVVDSPIDGGHATILTWWEAGWYYDATWGEEVRVHPDFIARQGQNLWRLDLA